MADKEDKLLNLILNRLTEITNAHTELSNQLSQTREELTKLSGIRYAVKDIKDWKEEIDKEVTIEDLKNMHDTVADYTEFKSKIVTTFKIIGGSITTGIAILGCYYGYLSIVHHS